MQKSMTLNLNRDSLETVRAAVRRRLVLPLASLACVLASGSAAFAQELDPDVQFVVDNGFETLFFAQTCRSIGPDGDVIEGEVLPVGNGRTLECETDTIGFLEAIDVQASTGELFCALGQISSFDGENIDPALSVSVASAPDGAPWTLVGTHDGGEITIGRVTGPGGGTAFPLGADVLFDVVDLQPNPNFQLCSDLFGL
jgi:hypothetical protein